MLRNYFKIALRNLFRHRTYSLINVLGLGLGLASGFIMLLWVNNEYSMNLYHSKQSRIYQLNTEWKGERSKNIFEVTQAPLAIVARDWVPDIEWTTRVNNHIGYKQVVKYFNQVFVEDKIGYTENDFFKIFDAPVLQGNPSSPFSPGLSAVMTESMAKKYFGSDSPLGKIIHFRDTTVQISAVIADFPASSSYHFELLVNWDFLRMKFRANDQVKALDEDWNNSSYQTFCLVRKGASIAKVAGQLLQAVRSIRPEAKDIATYRFRPLRDIYLYNTDGSKSRLVMVQIFFIVAVFVMLIACINYVNLVTARATQRVKEISLRKIIGAQKKDLFWQFFIETGLLLFFAAFTALFLALLMLPIYSQVSGNKLTFDIASASLWRVIVIILGTVWLLSGLYPSLLLSSFHPFRSLKGTGFLSNAGLLRKTLVVLQFVVSITLLLGTVFVHRQMNFVKDKDLNINTENVLLIQAWKIGPEHWTSFKQELQKFPAVLETSSGDVSLFDGANTTSGIEWPGKLKDEEMTIARMNVSQNFMDFFKTGLKEGEDFSSIAPNSHRFMLNETAVKKMRLTNPIGQQLIYNGDTGTVAGVVRDFYFDSFHNELAPAILSYNPDECPNIYVRVAQKDASSVIALAQKIWKSFEPDLPMEYGFIDEKIAQQYDKETRASRLFDAFTLITLFISCLGLFGLATHSTERRTKEIGIRKVMGARVSQLASLLSQEYVVLVMLALVISIPLVWIGMQYLLDNFVYRISLDWWTFVLTGMVAILLAVFTVSFKAVKAAMANPVKSLRTE